MVYVKDSVQMVGLMLEYYGSKTSDSVPDSRESIAPGFFFCRQVGVFYDYLGGPQNLLGA